MVAVILKDLNEENCTQIEYFHVIDYIEASDKTLSIKGPVYLDEDVTCLMIIKFKSKEQCEIVNNLLLQAIKSGMYQPNFYFDFSEFNNSITEYSVDFNDE